MKATFLAAIAAILLIGTSGCGTTRPHPGIEAGNPDLDPETTTIRAIPEEGDEIYEVTFLDENNASVSRVSSQSGSAVETVIVPYSRENDLLSLEASFSNENNIDLEATVDKEAGIVSGILKINGEEVDACFEMDGFSPSCEGSDSGASQTDGATQETLSPKSTIDDPVTVTTEEPENTEADPKTEVYSPPPSNEWQNVDLYPSPIYTDYDSDSNPDNTSDPPPGSQTGPAFTTPDWQIGPYRINDPTR